MNSFNPNYFIHACNILMLVAYCVRDILWLRLFAVAASLIAIPYFVLQPATLWAPLSWSALFAAINAYQSWRLFLDRRPVQLTPEEETARRLAFRDLPPRKVMQVLSLGSWITAEPGARLLERGKPAEAISLIISGKVRVTKDEEILGELMAGDLVGSALVLSGAMAEVDAVTVEPVRAMRWDIGTLEHYLTANPETRIVMQRHLASDLAGKLHRAGRNFLSTSSRRPPSPGGPSGSATDGHKD
jgi:CRP-like cAMP-binding protein